MRLLTGFLFLLFMFAYVESMRTGCFMSDMIGVDWLGCIIR
jgi:hypothetical protein